MPSTYTGNLLFMVGHEEHIANVEITAMERSPEAGGGWECDFRVIHNNTTHSRSSYLAGSVIKLSRLNAQLQSALRSMPEPLRSINLSRTGFKLELIG